MLLQDRVMDNTPNKQAQGFNLSLPALPMFILVAGQGQGKQGAQLMFAYLELCRGTAWTASSNNRQRH